MTSVTLTFDHFFLTIELCLPFYHSTPSCQSSYKSVNNFLSYWGNSLKIVIFNGYLTPVTFTCELQRWPIFLTIKLIFHFIIMHHPVKGHQNRSITGYWGKSLKTVIWSWLFDPCDLDLWPNFLTIKLSLPFFITHNQPKTSLNYWGNSLKIVF